MKRDELLFVGDILGSMNLIERFSKGLTKETFMKDELRQSAIVRQIEIIGEAVKNISDETKEKYPKIEWRKIAGTRDIIIHGYFKVDIETVWKTIKEDIPDVKEKIQRIKKDLEKNK